MLKDVGPTKATPPSKVRDDLALMMVSLSLDADAVFDPARPSHNISKAFFKGVLHLHVPIGMKGAGHHLRH